ncbi:MAG: alpha/beta hydrolase [Erysipelotrichaceae bacterium]|nr:alpha/beta hydrolase [Erysipelotrichaceae bacterium]
MEKILRFKDIKPTPVLYTDIVYSSRMSDFNTHISNLHMNIIVPTMEEGRIIKSPLFIWLEGGAWKTSSPYYRLGELSYFTNNGYIVADVEYSVESNNCWPACIEDVKTAIRYLRKNGDIYGIDTDHIYIGGESAGAHLAVLSALIDDKYITDEYKEYPSDVNGVISYYCPGDTDIPINNYFNYYDQLVRNDIDNNPILKAEINPLTYINKKTCPFLMFHGLSDTLVPVECSKNLYNKLIEYHTEADLYLIEDAEHADIRFSQPYIQKLVLEFMNRHL